MLKWIAALFAGAAAGALAQTHPISSADLRFLVRNPCCSLSRRYNCGKPCAVAARSPTPQGPLLRRASR